MTSEPHRSTRWGISSLGEGHIDLDIVPAERALANTRRNGATGAPNGASVGADALVRLESPYQRSSAR